MVMVVFNVYLLAFPFVIDKFQNACEVTTPKIDRISAEHSIASIIIVTIICFVFGKTKRTPTH